MKNLFFILFFFIISCDNCDNLIDNKSENEIIYYSTFDNNSILSINSFDLKNKSTNIIKIDAKIIGLSSDKIAFVRNDGINSDSLFILDKSGAKEQLVFDEITGFELKNPVSSISSEEIIFQSSINRLVSIDRNKNLTTITNDFYDSTFVNYSQNGLLAYFEKKDNSVKIIVLDKNFNPILEKDEIGSFDLLNFKIGFNKSENKIIYSLKSNEEFKVIILDLETKSEVILKDIRAIQPFFISDVIIGWLDIDANIFGKNLENDTIFDLSENSSDERVISFSWNYSNNCLTSIKEINKNSSILNLKKFLVNDKLELIDSELISNDVITSFWGRID